MCYAQEYIYPTIHTAKVVRLSGDVKEVVPPSSMLM